MMRRYFELSAILLALFALCWPRTALAGSHALVIGIDAYDNLGSGKQLEKAVNDARAVGRALERLGFDVIRGENVGRRDLAGLLARFYGRVRPGDVAAFYFSGHGVQLDGRNYLIPRDIPKLASGQAALMRSEAIGFDRIAQELERRGARVRWLILDACRDNPFARAGTKGLGGTKGLARAEPSEGSFIMYSAGAGQQALDRLSDADTSPNSVYTRALLPLLRRPGLDLSAIARGVRRRVHGLAARIGHRQSPAYYDGLTEAFYPARDLTVEELVGGGEPPPPPPPPPAPPPASPPPAPKRWIRHFITEEFLRDREHFAEWVDYYDKGVVGRAYIMKDRLKYARRWPDRHYELIPGTLSIQARGAGEWVVTLGFTFRVANWQRGKKVSGRGATRVVLRESGDGFVITDVKEIVER